MLIAPEEAVRITRYLDVRTAMPGHADLAFVFGTRHPEPAVMAVDLVRRGIVCHVVLTGGQNRLTGRNEAREHLKILLSSGVPRDRIIVEHKSTNTLENVVFALREVGDHVDLPGIKAIVVLTKWYHCRRAMMTLKRHLPEGIRYFAASYEPATVTRCGWWLSEEGRRPVLKEWRSIPDYLSQGDIAEIREDSGAFV
jgi:uncharacterized SAM-binding protein YcdF (DUF218 family)